MKRSFFIFVVIFSFAFALQAQNNYPLPPGAKIIETQAIKPNKTLVLWMINPKKNPRPGGTDDTYSCPDYTRGSYYEGKTRVSLINTKTRNIINTIEINKDGEDSFDIPYLIERHYYKVPVINAHKEGKPKILSMGDFNNDGQAAEFALYDAQACMGLDTTLIGYSEKQDKVIQYPVRLTTDKKTETFYWVDYFFARKPIRKGFWKYEIDYRGRAGSLDKYEIHFDKTTESFSGTLQSTNAEN